MRKHVVPFLLVHTAFRIGAPLGGAMLLARAHGPWVAIGAVAAIGAALAVVGAVLLRRSPLGKISWQNVLAGWCMPWAFALGGGSLPWLAFSSALGVTVLAAMGALGTSPWLLAAWLVDGACAMYLLRLRANHCHHRAQRRFVHSALALVAVLAGLGLALAALDQPIAGAIVAAAPLLLLAAAYGVLLATTLATRPKRWL